MGNIKYIVIPRKFHNERTDEIETTAIWLSSDGQEEKADQIPPDERKKRPVRFLHSTNLNDLYFISLTNPMATVIDSNNLNNELRRGLTCLITHINTPPSSPLKIQVIVHWKGEQDKDTLVLLCDSLESSLREEFENVEVGYICSHDKAGRRKQYDAIVGMRTGKTESKTKKETEIETEIELSFENTIYKLLSSCIITTEERTESKRKLMLAKIHNIFQTYKKDRFLSEKQNSKENLDAMEKAQLELTEAIKELDPSFEGFPWKKDINVIHNEFANWLKDMGRYHEQHSLPWKHS